MSNSTFHEFITDYICPMFPGANYDGKPTKLMRRSSKLTSWTTGRNGMRIKEGINENEYTIITRPQRFDQSERRFVGELIKSHSEIISLAPSQYHRLREHVVQKAIAATITEGRRCEELLNVIDIMNSWSNQTYEGDRVTVGALLDGADSQINQVALKSLSREDYIRALTDGVDTFWRVSIDGTLGGIVIGNPAHREKAGRYPARYAALANMSVDGAVGVALNRNGEILVFVGGELKYTRRRGIWQHYAHNSVITQIKYGNRELKQSVYDSVLDASFARSGACIGIVTVGMMKAFEESGVVSEGDYHKSLGKGKSKLNSKAALIGQIVNKRKFQEMERTLRKELLGLDGATVLSPDGRILAVGAIVDITKIDKGNTGGRAAAAKALSKYGFGIKVSEDGAIKGYSEKTPIGEPLFSIG